MANLKKPSKKFEWKGQKGNKYRVYTVTTLDGNQHTFTDSKRANSVYNANVKMYNKLKKRGY